MRSIKDLLNQALMERIAKKRLKEINGGDHVTITRNLEEEDGDVIMVVVRVSEWDESANDLWDEEAAKSIPRDLKCALCGEQVVMSHKLFSSYEKRPRPDLVQCAHCVFKI